MPHEQEIQPTSGVTGLIDLFDQYPLVALGEMHAIEQSARFIDAVIRHPILATRVDVKPRKCPRRAGPPVRRTHGSASASRGRCR